MIIPPEHDKLKQNEQNCMWVKNFWLIGKINKLFKISHKTEKFSVKIMVKILVRYSTSLTWLIDYLDGRI